MELVEMVWRIPEAEVSGWRPGWNPQDPDRFVAREMLAVMKPGTQEVATIMFWGYRILRRRPGGMAKVPGRFFSDDPTLAERKLAARRIASAAQHKAAGDPAGRRAS